MSTQLPYQLDTLQEIATGIADPGFFSELNELREKLQVGRINLVVLGLFKRGKSSLVNSLLGCSLAPVGLTPLTAIVTSFEHDPDRSYARVYFKDGHHIDTGATDITPYVSEEENPHNEKNVSIVRIFDRVLPVLKRITLIDTPGLGSAHLHNTATTVEFIPRIDAGLFVLSADLPISEADIDFLKTLKDTVPAIIFVLNKKDLLDEKELYKLIAHNQKMIISQVGLDAESAEIIPVSARCYLQGRHGASNMDTLNRRIRSLIESSDEALLHQAVGRRMAKLCTHISLLLRTRLEALQLPLHDLESRQKQLHKIPVLLESRKDDFEDALKGQTSRLQEYVRQTMQDLTDQLRKELPEKVSFISSRLADNPSEQGHPLSEWILGLLKGAHASLETIVKTRFDDMLQQYARQPGTFLSEVVLHLSAVMGIDFDVIAEKFDLDVYAPFYLSLDAGPFPTVDGFFPARFLPRSTRQRRFHRRLLEYYNGIIVRNAAAVIYNLDYRIQESLRKFSSDLRQRLHELVNNVQSLLTETIRLHADYQAGLDEKSGEVRDKLISLEALQQAQMPATQSPIP